MSKIRRRQTHGRPRAERACSRVLSALRALGRKGGHVLVLPPGVDLRVLLPRRPTVAFIHDETRFMPDDLGAAGCTKRRPAETPSATQAE